MSGDYKQGLDKNWKMKYQSNLTNPGKNSNGLKEVKTAKSDVQNIT
jgi:hypothetical protein